MMGLPNKDDEARKQIRRTNRNAQLQFRRNVDYSPLPPNVKAVLSLLATSLDSKLDYEVAWTSATYLAKRLNYNTRTVEKLLRIIVGRPPMFEKGLGLFYVVQMSGKALEKLFRNHGHSIGRHSDRVRWVLNTYRPARHWMWTTAKPTSEQYALLLETYTTERLNTGKKTVINHGVLTACNPGTETGQVLEKNLGDESPPKAREEVVSPKAKERDTRAQRAHPKLCTVRDELNRALPKAAEPRSAPLALTGLAKPSPVASIPDLQEHTVLYQVASDDECQFEEELGLLPAAPKVRSSVF